MPDPASLPDRRATILDAAKRCFLDRGFLRTSISDVVAISGGSRSTVYAEFGSKEGLFAALIGSILGQMRLPEIPCGAPEKVLPDVGRAYLEQLLDPESLALYRVVLGESAHVRQLGPAIFAAGPRAAAAVLAERMRTWCEEGDLDLADADQAAVLFLGMIEADLHRGAIMWQDVHSPEQIAAHVDVAVGLFLRGARPAERHA